MTKSAKATMADRGLALASLHTARSEVAHKRSKLHKLRGTPGIRVRTAWTQRHRDMVSDSLRSLPAMHIPLHAAACGTLQPDESDDASEIPIHHIACRQRTGRGEAGIDPLHTIPRRHTRGRRRTGYPRMLYQLGRRRRWRRWRGS